jgi:ABC-type ATPase involved in cell division
VGVTVIIATHDALGNANYQNKVLHLNQGRLVNIDAPANLEVTT